MHPNTKAKSGKFDCATMSLSVLLDYRTDDNKEGTFEVSLFAELFNEMLMRDCGFQLYRWDPNSLRGLPFMMSALRGEGCTFKSRHSKQH